MTAVRDFPYLANISLAGRLGNVVSFPDPNNPSEDRLQYLAGKEGLVI